MKKTSKKWIILLSVYLIVLAVLLLLPGCAINYVLTNAMQGAGSSRYTEAATLYRSLDQLDPMERSKAFLLRDALSDMVMDEGVMSLEFCYDFYYPSEQHAYENGCFARVCRPNEEGEEVNFSENFALVDLKKLSEAGAGDALYEFCRQDIEPRIKVEQYALDDYECYPLQLSLYNYDTLLKTLSVNQDLDLSGMEVYTADDVFLNTYSLPEKIDYIRSGRHEARDRVEQLKQNCDYSVEQVISKKTVTPFTATITFVSTKDGCGFFSVTRLHSEKLLTPIRIVCFVGWTVIMGIIVGSSLIVMRVARKR